MIRRPLLLLAAIAALGALLTLLAIASGGAPAEAKSRVGVFAQVSGDSVGGRSSDSPAKRRGPTAKSGGIASAYLVAARGADEAFHYTRGEFADLTARNGLREGSYVTKRGGLSPLQAQLDLALPPNRGLSDAVIRVDLAGLRKSGFDVGDFTTVGRRYNMLGGGTELRFDRAIPPEFVQVVRP